MLLSITLLLLFDGSAFAQCGQAPDLRIGHGVAVCKEYPVGLSNSSTFPLDSVKSFRWDFGDGAVINGSPSNNSAHWGNSNGRIPGHLYKKDGLYDLQFTVELKNGFKDTTAFQLLVKSTMKIKLLNTNSCGTKKLIFTSDLAQYKGSKFRFEPPTWTIHPIGKAGPFETTNQFEADPPSEDSYVIANSRARYSTCPNMRDTFIVKATAVRALINRFPNNVHWDQQFQCDAYDTVFFTNNSTYPDKFDVSYLWNFGDQYAEQCTTDTKNGVNVGRNCNYSRDTTPKHKYMLVDSIYHKFYYSKNVSLVTGEVNSSGIYQRILVDTNDVQRHRELFDDFIMKPYWASLTATSKSGCFDIDSIPIVNSTPNASSVLVSPFYGTMFPQKREAGIRINLARGNDGVTYPQYKITYEAGDNKPKWLDLSGHAGSTPLLGTDLGSYVYFCGRFPDEVYARVPENLKLGKTTTKDIGIIASLGYSQTGSAKKCADTVLIGNRFQASLFDLQFDLIDGVPDYKDSNSVTVRFKNKNQRPNEFGFYVYGRGSWYEEKLNQFIPNTTGKSHRSELVRVDGDGIHKPDTTTIVTSTYNVYPVIAREKLPREAYRWMHAQGIDPDLVSDSLLIQSFGDGTVSTLFDTTGMSSLIESAFELRMKDKKVKHAADTSLVGQLPNGDFRFVQRDLNKVYSYLSDSNSNLYEDHISCFVLQDRAGHAEPFSSETFSFPPERHHVFVHNMSEGNLEKSQYLFGSAPNGYADTIVIDVKAFYLDSNKVDYVDSVAHQKIVNYGYSATAAISDVSFKENGKWEKLNGTHLWDRNRDWYDLITNGSKDKLMIDWDERNTKDKIDTVYDWHNKLARFKHVPDTAGYFNGRVISVSSNGSEIQASFRYSTIGVEKSSLIEETDIRFDVTNDCKHTIEIKNTSTVELRNSCGVLITNYDSIASVKYVWGDGDSTETVIGDSVKHTYAKGTYTLKTVYTTNFGYSFATEENYDFGQLLPEIQFDYNVNNDTLHLFGPELGDSLSLVWKFGDGDSSVDINPIHGYKQNKVYDVCLKVKNDVRGCELSLCRAINPMACNARFYAVKDTFHQFGVWVVDQSTGSNLDYVWEFGDGDSAHKQYPDHVYAKFGKYDVCLEVSNANCKSVYCDSVGMNKDGNLLKADGFSIQVVHPDKLSVNAIEKTGFWAMIHPNPANHMVRINTNDPAPIVDVFLMDAMGRQVSVPVDQTLSSLDVSNVKPGLYSLVALTNTNRYTFKLIVLE